MLECLDVLNETLMGRGEEPVAFEHDCREGICGILRLHDQRHCARTTAGNHGLPADDAPLQRWRRAGIWSRGARAPSPREGPGGRPQRLRPHHRRRRLRLGFDGQCARWQRDPQSPRKIADIAMDAAACIGCGACVAACPNAAAALVHRREDRAPRHSSPGQAGADRRAVRMVAQMNVEGFGSCTNIGECTGVCPKEIPLEVISPHEPRLRGCGIWKKSADPAPYSSRSQHLLLERMARRSLRIQRHDNTSASDDSPLGGFISGPAARRAATSSDSPRRPLTRG
jgi:succinate dehydrogenase / fumarate reductase iron-sulfur subunit